MIDVAGGGDAMDGGGGGGVPNENYNSSTSLQQVPTYSYCKAIFLGQVAVNNVHFILSSCQKSKALKADFFTF